MSKKHGYRAGKSSMGGDEVLKDGMYSVVVEDVRALFMPSESGWVRGERVESSDWMKWKPTHTWDRRT